MILFKNFHIAFNISVYRYFEETNVSKKFPNIISSAPNLKLSKANLDKKQPPNIIVRVYEEGVQG